MKLRAPMQPALMVEPYQIDFQGKNANLTFFKKFTFSPFIYVKFRSVIVRPVAPMVDTDINTATHLKGGDGYDCNATTASCSTRDKAVHPEHSMRMPHATTARIDIPVRMHVHSCSR